ncbi:MAG: hypothetical protein Q8S17_02005, partial [Humidesulfovibrio sp.]|nr:hypothetical protein [Humidesulfovibrio sp.]
LSNFGDSVTVPGNALSTSITGGAGDAAVVYAPAGTSVGSPAVVTGTINGGGGTNNTLGASAGVAVDFTAATILNIQNVSLGAGSTGTFTAAQIDYGYLGGSGFPAHTSSVETLTGTGLGANGATFIVKDPGSAWYYDFSNIIFENWGNGDILDITGSSTYANLYNMGMNMASYVYIHGAGGTLEFIPDSDHPDALANVSDIDTLIFGDFEGSVEMDPLPVALPHDDTLTIDTTSMTAMIGGSLTLDASALSAKLDYHAGAGNDHITGTGQNDSFSFGENLTSGDSITGGGGTDKLYFTPSATQTSALEHVQGISKIYFGDPGGTVVMDTLSAGLQSAGTLYLDTTGVTAPTSSITLNASALSATLDYTAGAGID